jgi:hypothetical protein
MMDQQNYYAYFADYLPHRIKKTKQYDDYMDEFFECPSNFVFFFGSDLTCR